MCHTLSFQVEKAKVQFFFVFSSTTMDFTMNAAQN